MPRQTSEPTANRRNGRLSVFRLGDTHTQVLVYTSFLCGFYDIGFSLTESISHCILTILFAFITILTVQSGNLRMLFAGGKIHHRCISLLEAIIVHRHYFYLAAQTEKINNIFRVTVLFEMITIKMYGLFLCSA